MLTSATLTIAELFSGPYMFNVPAYQRAYAWGSEQAEQLLEDLLEAVSDGLGETDDKGFFLGTILLMDAPGNETKRLSPKMSPREFDIVDGQQRLVTLQVVLAILRDLETEARSALARRANVMLTAQQGSRFFRTERFRLHVSGGDRPVFEGNILAFASTGKAPAQPVNSRSSAALIAVRDVVRSALADLPAALRVGLFDYIANKVHVVVLVSHDIDHAHRMFVVLNDRGKALERNDILKADLMSRLPADRLEPAGVIWHEASEALGKGLEPLFGHIRTIYGQTRPRILQAVRNVVRDVGGSDNFLSEVFQPLARSYALVRNGGAGTAGLSPEIVRRLVYLNRLSDADWAPAAMLALRDWPRDPARSERLLIEVDRLAHGTRLLCCGSAKRARQFMPLINALNVGEDIGPDHPCVQFTREEVRSMTFHLKDLHKRNPKVCKLLLLRLSDELAGTTSLLAPEAYTVEHVLPQRPSAKSDWRTWFPHAEQREQATECLGNLVLISQSQNDKARNASWSAKRAIYADAPQSAPLLEITRDVLDVEAWTVDAVAAREERLMNLIAKTWRITFNGKGR